MIEPQATRARILIIDDEPQIRKFLDISLRTQGYDVFMAHDGQSGLDALATQGAELVILDMGLPDMDGYQVLSQLREWSKVPVLMLSVRAEEAGKVAVLDAGANDYVTKPFSVPELMARVRALLRTHATEGDASPSFDDGVLRMDLVLREVSIRGEVVQLARKEYALLALLVRHAGRVVTQPQILNELWGHHHEHDTHYLRVLLGKLRQKLGDNAASPSWIATEPGIGLRFIGEQKVS